MAGGSLLCVLLLLLLLVHAPLSLTTDRAGAAAAKSSFLHLSPGLNLRILPSYNLTSRKPLSLNRTFSVATPTLDEGLFFPILSSPSFYTSFLNSYSSSSPRSGYSLGFYLKPTVSPPPDPIFYPCYPGCNVYLAVCAGSLGSTDNVSQIVRLGYRSGLMNDSITIHPYKTVDGFAVPVWIANLENPIRYADQASLIVADSAVLELQLRDGEHVVWHVRNANIMEMQDTGNLSLIDNSTNRSHLVWHSSPITDVLIEGQSLAAGKELISNDSSYVARMEKGGFVFYMNKIHFNREWERPPPYWVFPFYNEDAGSKSLNQLISSAPCSNSPAHLALQFLIIDLFEGSCSSNQTQLIFSGSEVPIDFSWSFMRLEGDGMLYSYVVSSHSTGSAASVIRYPLTYYSIASLPIVFTPLVLGWKECSVPMACGPFGVCTPGGLTWCSCSEEQGFKPINITNIYQGCKRSIDLPNCTNFNGTLGRHSGSTDFVQLNSTASVLLFNEWTFTSTPGVEACKRSCSSDCSCNGFFYRRNTSSCFFITDGITLLTVVDGTNYTSIQHPFSEQVSTIFARDYVTFLKVASGNTTNVSELPKKRSSMAALIALGAIIPSLLVCVVLGSCLFRARRSNKFVHTSPNILSKEESKELQNILPLLPNRYSYKELFEATEGFSKLLGAGGCGSVYAGILPDGSKVAVKVLQVVLQGTQHSKQFLAEIATIGRIAHHNIVRLVGFCWEVSQRLLVYEYIERGSLDRWIFVKEPVACADDDTDSAAVAAYTHPFLDWKTRYNVALGIARGLTYLHEDCEKPILHFDIKPQNILLDNGFVAKLADFGMSRLIERDMSAVVTGMRGTPGYIAPEWCSQGTVSKKSDVYSMGMVLLEIVGGRRNLDFSLLNSSCELAEQEAWHFPSWAAMKCEQGLTMELVDKRLQNGGGFDEVQAVRLIHVAFWCIQENPAMRPNAATVVQWLDGISSVGQPPFSMAVNAGRRPNKLVAISFTSHLASSQM